MKPKLIILSHCIASKEQMCHTPMSILLIDVSEHIYETQWIEEFSFGETLLLRSTGIYVTGGLNAIFSSMFSL